MKRLAGVLIGLFASAALADTIDITVIRPTTGTMAASGDDIAQGARAAQQVINAQGRDTVTLHFEDDGCEPKQAVSVANRIAASGATLVFGPFCSNATLAAMDTFRETGIAQLTLSQAGAVTARRHPGLYRINAGNDQIADAIATEVRSVQNMALVYDRAPYGRSLADELTPRFKAMGHIPLPLEFNEGERDFAGLATTLRHKNIDTIVLAGNAGQMGLVLRQMREHGVTARVITPGTGTLPDFAATAFCAAANTTAIGTRVDHQRYDAAPAIQAAFSAQNAKPVDTVLLSYAAIETLVEAHRRSGNPAQNLGQGNFHTLIGDISWDIHGNLRHAPIALYRWGCENGRAVLGSPTIP